MKESTGNNVCHGEGGFSAATLPGFTPKNDGEAIDRPQGALSELASCAIRIASGGTGN
jgi:hypothetical protein